MVQIIKKLSSLAPFSKQKKRFSSLCLLIVLFFLRSQYEKKKIYYYINEGTNNIFFFLVRVSMPKFFQNFLFVPLLEVFQKCL